MSITKTKRGRTGESIKLIKKAVPSVFCLTRERSSSEI
jgi:hypothetical protein